MNRALFKHDLKSNWLLFLIILAIMLMYISIISLMYDPGSVEAINQLMAAMPKQLVSALGFDTIGSTLTGFISGYYYSFVVILFPMIYCIILSGRLVSRFVDRGSMAYLLSGPLKRSAIAGTQAVYFIISLTALFSVNTLIGYLICEAKFPGLLDIGKFLAHNYLALFIFFAVSGMLFFFSCAFDDAKLSSSLGAGIPLAFYVIQMLSKVDDKLSWLKNFTIFTLYDTEKIMSGGPILVNSVVLLGIAAVMFTGGILTFSRRDIIL